MNKAELARAYGVSIPAVDAWIRRGCPHQKRNRRYHFDRAAVAEWRAAAIARDRGLRPPAPGEPGPRQLIEMMALPEEQLLPWLGPDVMTVSEYREEAGMDADEFVRLLTYGLPLLPPEEEGEEGRVSRPHADRWRLLFESYLRSLGGKPGSPGEGEVGREAHLLRGLPPG